MREGGFYYFSNLFVAESNYMIPNPWLSKDKIMGSRYPIRIVDSPIEAYHAVLPEWHTEYIKDVYDRYHHLYELYRRVILIKSTLDTHVTTPSRSIVLDPMFIPRLEEKLQAKFILVHDITSIRHLICILYHARWFMGSYGASFYTNRLFLHPDATAVILGNQAYQSEFRDANGEINTHFCYFISDIRRHIFVFDFPDTLNEETVEDLVHLPELIGL
jgi:hypothetical protein